MKKITIILSTLILSMCVWGQSVNSDYKKDMFYIGDYALMQNGKCGGGFGFGIPVFQQKTFFIKDEISANLYFSNLPESNGKLVGICDKLMFGSLKSYGSYSVRTYGYMKSVFGISMDEQFGFFTAPMILEMGGAGGFEFLFCENKGFYMEFGGGAVIKDWGQVSRKSVAKGCFDGSYVCITTGMRHYF